MLPENLTAVVARNEIWTGDSATEPYEAGWAKEVVVFVRALKEPIGALPKARIEISADGMHWAPEHVNPMVALRTTLCSQRWAVAWPAVLQHLRDQRRERSRQRWLRRHPPAAPSIPAPAPATSPDRTTPRVHLSKAAQRMRDRDHPKVVDGRPTPDHPWRDLAKTG